MKTPGRKTPPRRQGWQAWGKRIALTQIAAQIGLIVGPLYTAHVYAQEADANAQEQQQTEQQKQQDAHLQKLAEITQQIGQSVSTPNGNVDLKGMAGQQISGAAAEAAQNALSQFGTARVDLGAVHDMRNFSGAVDTLIPLVDTESNLFFTQLGLRRNDGQFTGNLGFGHRHFTDNWMLGYNAFYDQNISRGHQRFGVGIEAWRDYLKLSGNAYVRISDWKASPDLLDYDERPANGFDLRAEGYLPSMPSLGAKLMYEQYFGNEVGLFGPSNRASNPAAVTVGLNYTPIPLVSIGVDHRRGNGGNSTSANVQFTYQLGQPWSKQIDPAQVAARRSLAGSRTDLVERNNNIVLEYRKRQMIKLNLPAQVTGKSANTVDLHYTVEAKHGLGRIQWQDGALVAAGGAIVDAGGGNYQVRMPLYQAGTANAYPLTGVAYDVQGNASQMAATTVIVSPGDPDAAKSTVSASPLMIPATGKGVSVVTINLADKDGNAIGGAAETLSATLTETLDAAGATVFSLPPQPATLGTVAEVQPGVYQVTVTSGTRPGTLVVSPKVQDAALAEVTIAEVADAESARFEAGNFVVVADGAVATGTATNQVKARVTDEAGNALAGITVAFSLSGSAQVAGGGSLNVKTDADGYAVLAFTDVKAEVVTIGASLVNGASASVQATFIADAATASLTGSDIGVDKPVVIANGIDRAQFSATVKDANGNVVPGVTVEWKTDVGALSGTSSTTDANGVATANLSHMLAGIAQVTAKVGSATAVNAPTVTFVGDSSSAGIGSGDFTVDKTTIVANDTDIATYTAIVKDAKGNVVVGVPVAWATDLGTLSAETTPTDATGTAKVSLHGTKAGTAQVTAQVNATPVDAPKVTLTADSASAGIGSDGVTVDKTSVGADGTDVATFKALVKDANGNPVRDVDVTWSTTFGNLGGTTSKTDANGIATVTLSSTALGAAQVQARLGSSAAVDAPVVTFIGSIATARISALTSSIAKITATGGESTTLTATVTDAAGHAVPDATVDWSTTAGDLAGATSNTGADGKATVTFTAVRTETTNGTATITAGINSTTRDTNVTLRTVLEAGGKYYWTQNTDYKPTSEANSDAMCSAHGGGTTATQADLQAFATAGGDFKGMKVTGEYAGATYGGWYRLGGTWTTTAGKFDSTGDPVGHTLPPGMLDNISVCVK
ncbi:inverse autotransporter beta domain-containing protein [Ralstonia insidiosa]|uniref:Uncharacterized protein n=2 Tax=Bacteria TaxID=2 RepID=A0A192A4W6_9RALS|nr:inverse autotransporter beta domain-containing protein [Ralstonia insidiosa]ANJ75301.1 hypothetical protein A9Y76_22575 [Ralstonia insidiosa]KAB0467965.1 hypothetical protein F7R11_22175 [Ralstonia insidiosa]MBY4910642.1 inverse autotransporter beta domain-containing protein [Ralstonia insidiosa]